MFRVSAPSLSLTKSNYFNLFIKGIKLKELGILDWMSTVLEVTLFSLLKLTKDLSWILMKNQVNLTLLTWQAVKKSPNHCQ